MQMHCNRKTFPIMHLCSSTYLTVLIELTAEGDSKVGGRAGGVVAGEQVLVIVESCTSALADLHVLEAGLHTAQQERAALTLVSSEEYSQRCGYSIYIICR